MVYTRLFEFLGGAAGHCRHGLRAAAGPVLGSGGVLHAEGYLISAGIGIGVDRVLVGAVDDPILLEVPGPGGGLTQRKVLEADRKGSRALPGIGRELSLGRSLRQNGNQVVPFHRIRSRGILIKYDNIE